MGEEHSPLEEIVRYKKDPNRYLSPEEEKTFFEAFSLGDYLAYTEFTSSLCMVMQCSLSDQSRTEHSTRQIKALFCNKLRTVAHYENLKLGNVPSATSGWPKPPSPRNILRGVARTFMTHAGVIHIAAIWKGTKCTLLSGSDVTTADIHKLRHVLMLYYVLPACPVCNILLNSDGNPDLRGLAG